MAPIIGGSYGVGPEATGPTSDMLHRSALLHAGDGAVLSGETAASRLIGWDRGSSVIHVTSPQAILNVDPRFSFHRTRATRSGAVHICNSWPVPAPPDLCLDLARNLTPFQLARVICELRYQRLTTLESLEQSVRRRVGVPGSGVLRRALWLVRNDSAGTRGSTEDEYLRVTEAGGLSTPLVNTRSAASLPNDEPDFYYSEVSLNVECDGGHHLESGQQRQDEERDMLVAQRGSRVLRIWWRDMWTRPAAVLAHVRLALGDRSDPVEFVQRRWAGDRYRLTL
jgi:hypothetical protein